MTGNLLPNGPKPTPFVTDFRHPLWLRTTSDAASPNRRDNAIISGLRPAPGVSRPLGGSNLTLGALV